MILGLIGLFYLFGDYTFSSDTFAQLDCDYVDQTKCLNSYHAKAQDGDTLYCRAMQEYIRCLSYFQCFPDSQAAFVMDGIRKSLGTSCPGTELENAASPAYSSRNLALLSVVILSSWFYV